MKVQLMWRSSEEQGGNSSVLTMSEERGGKAEKLGVGDGVKLSACSPFTFTTLMGSGGRTGGPGGGANVHGRHE